MKSHQRTEGLCDEWLTPPDILTKLGTFNLDPACPRFMQRPIAGTCYSSKEDGLKQHWFGRVWLNPPFNRYTRPKWMEKMADHGNGIMLIPAATETKAFFDYVWRRADAVCFLRGRPHFYTPDTEHSGIVVPGKRAKANCGCSICLVAYGHTNAKILEDSGLGKTVRVIR